MRSFIAVFASTTRSQAYIQSLVRSKMLPSYVVILDERSDSLKIRPEHREIKKFSNTEYNFGQASLNIKESIVETLNAVEIPFDVIAEPNINSPKVVELIDARDEQHVIVSVYGGQILKKEILSRGKFFIHVHSGLLPNYRGSTTIYYSILNEGSIGVTSILLDDGIDTGRIIYKHSYKINFDLRLIDHVYDPLIRSNHLIETIKMLQLKDIVLEQQNDPDSQTYYVIHPVLKHVAIKKGLQHGLE